MSDHKASKPRTVGVRELKAHAAKIVRHVREAREVYVITHRGRPAGVLLPITEADAGAESDTRWSEFLNAGRRLQPRFRPGVSGVKLLSGSRR